MPARTDNHVSGLINLTVPDGKMAEIKALFAGCYKETKAGTKACLYYGFQVHENKVVSREGYKNADGVLAHLGETKAYLDKLVAIVGEGGIEIHVTGPPRELEKLKEPMAPLGTKFYDTDRGCMWFGGMDEGPDTHVTIVPYFTVPDGKMAEFKKGFGSFYKGTRNGTKEVIYYGFAVCENKVHCREGYKSADGVLAHLGDVKEQLDKAVGIVGEGGLDLAVMGPAEELEKLKGALTPLGAKFYETDAGSMWLPTGSSDPKLSPAPAGATEMKVTMQKGTGLYVNAACSFLRGVEAKPARDGKEASEAKPAVEHLRISALGDAINVAVSAATKVVSENLGTIINIQTAYPDMDDSGRACGQIVIDLKKK